MHGYAEFAIRFGDHLSFENAISGRDDGLRGLANVLFERQDQLLRQGHLDDRGRRRVTLVARQAQAAMQLAKIVGGSGHASGLIVMQSTGQGATQSSQPVHSASMTVCMNWCAPTIASTGQALRQ